MQAKRRYRRTTARPVVRTLGELALVLAVLQELAEWMIGAAQRRLHEHLSRLGSGASRWILDKCPRYQKLR